MNGWRGWRRAPRWAFAALVATGLGADLLAAERPLLAACDGGLHLLPNLRAAPFVDEDQQTLRRRCAWIIGTPIPYSPDASRPGGVMEVLAPPSPRHLLGTDDRGRDVAARLIHGCRTTLLVGGTAVVLQLVLGLLVGLLGAVAPRLDLLLGRLVEAMMALPSFLLLLALQGALGPPSTLGVGVAIALVRWPVVARLARVAALAALAAPHVEAARSVGVGRARLLLCHVVPFALGPPLAAAALGLGHAVLVEAALAYLGLGVPAPTASWGELLAQAHDNGLPYWLVFFPALALVTTLLASNALGDQLQRRLRPDRGEA